MSMKIGFIGQGFIGKSYADDFERRDFEVVRYALEEPYKHNKDRVKECDVVFIAVPTPTTEKGHDVSIVESVLSLTAPNQHVIVRSTLMPGTTDSLQAAFEDRHVFFAPEFLIAREAAENAMNPIFNIIGLPERSKKEHKKAQMIIDLLPKAQSEHIMTAYEAELFKYIHNIHGYFRVMFTNLMYDAAENLGARWEVLEEAMAADPFMTDRASYYNRPVHDGGRGAGGPCFIKDMAAFRELYESAMPEDTHGINILKSMERKNAELLKASGKDQELLRLVYGDSLNV